MPHLLITIFTDNLHLDSPCFDEIRHLKAPLYSYIDKIEPLRHSPYDRTLFLDSDTYVCCNFDELFELLDRFEIAVAHDMARVGHPISDCPESFLEPNTGVILYKNNLTVTRFFGNWLTFYQSQLQAKSSTPPHDQSAFRKALFESTLSLYILPPEYNYTVWVPGLIGGDAKVKIVHGRNGRLQQTADIINQSLKARVFLPSLAFFNSSSFNILSPSGHRFFRFVEKLAAARSFLSKVRKPIS